MSLSSDCYSASERFYRDVMRILFDAKIPFLVGGGRAIQVYSGLVRKTKDLDLFLLPGDVETALHRLTLAGFETDRTYSHWLAKAISGDSFVDIIFNSGNGCCSVDAAWFEHATDAQVLGLTVRVCPAEESIWQKAFIMERERYDGADVAHLLKACAATMDWRRLIARFGSHAHVLLAHLVLFDYIYPGERSLIPRWVVRELLRKLDGDLSAPLKADFCYGTILSREQFQMDIDEEGYCDARLPPVGSLTPRQISQWTPAE